MRDIVIRSHFWVLLVFFKRREVAPEVEADEQVISGPCSWLFIYYISFLLINPQKGFK